jgi:hypothetical protein
MKRLDKEDIQKIKNKVDSMNLKKEEIKESLNKIRSKLNYLKGNIISIKKQLSTARTNIEYLRKQADRSRKERKKYGRKASSQLAEFYGRKLDKDIKGEPIKTAFIDYLYKEYQKNQQIANDYHDAIKKIEQDIQVYSSESNACQDDLQRDEVKIKFFQERYDKEFKALNSLTTKINKTLNTNHVIIGWTIVERGQFFKVLTEAVRMSNLSVYTNIVCYFIEKEPEYYDGTQVPEIFKIRLTSTKLKKVRKGAAIKLYKTISTYLDGRSQD